MGLAAAYSRGLLRPDANSASDLMRLYRVAVHTSCLALTVLIIESGYLTHRKILENVYETNMPANL